MLKIRYDYRLFSILNFPGVAILDFMRSNGCPYCETIEQPYYVMKSNMAAPGKFEMKNRPESNSVLSDTEMLFPCFPKKFIIRLYFRHFKSGDFV